MLEILLVASLCLALLLMTNFGRTVIRWCMCRYGYIRIFVSSVFLSILVLCIWSAVVQLDLLYSPGDVPSAPGTSKHEDVKVDEDGGFFYGIMFDAGSTGSRIHVYKFKHAGPSGEHELIEELFEQIKPGLSSYAADPHMGAESLRPLLDKAMKYVPQSLWTSTPLALKATAGLRLLSEKTAQQLLDEVEKLFKTYPFRLRENSVTILEGTDEGLLCWFTVNFLHGVLKNSTAMMGVLDLGGGSVQITFHSESVMQLDRAVDVSIYGVDRTLYSHSYLGLGLMSGRFQVLGGEQTSDGVQSSSLNSSCLPRDYNGTWKHGGKTHQIAGSPAGTRSQFDECYAAVHRVVSRYEFDRPPEISRTTFYALSYYVDTAADVNILADIKDGGVVTVQDFYNAAQKVCADMTKENPFFCLDTCYISALLHDALGFEKSAQLVLRKKIKGIEIQWPVGAMFEVYGLFQRRHSS